MANMFYNAIAFNQNIGAWTTSALTDVSQTFRNAAAFNQDIAGWDIADITTAASMFLSSGLSTANLDALYIGWEAQTEPPNITFHGGSACYSAGAAATARAALVTNGWIITDGNQCP